MVIPEIEPARSSIDLDIGAILLDTNHAVVGCCYFGNKVFNHHAVWLNQDNLTGRGEGDDETIFIHTDHLPPSVNTILITITSWSEHPFNHIKNAYLRIDEELETKKNPLFVVDLTTLNTGKAAIIGKFEKTKTTHIPTTVSWDDVGVVDSINSTEWYFTPTIKLLNLKGRKPSTIEIINQGVYQ